MVSPEKQNTLELPTWPTLQLFAKKEGETESCLHKTVKTQMQEEYDEQQWRWSEGLMPPVMSCLWWGGL